MPNDKSKKTAGTKRATARAAGRTAAQSSQKAQARKTTGMNRASARAAGRTRSTMATPGKITEAGVTGASVAKLVTGLAKSFGKSKPKPSSSSGSSPKWRDFEGERKAQQSYNARQKAASEQNFKARQQQVSSDIKAVGRIKKDAAKRGNKGSTLSYNKHNIKYGNR